MRSVFVELDTSMNRCEMPLPPDSRAMIQAQIHISPFTYLDLDRALDEVNEADAERALQNHLGRPYALTTSGRHALAMVLADARLTRDDTVTILTTTGNTYVSGCVTQSIGKLCHWSMKIEPSTRLIVVIHEWGVPYPKMDEVLGTGIPVVEDCAYAFASTHKGEQVGRKGKYAIFSLTKFFPINFGGVVCGVRQPAEILSEYRRAILNVLGSELQRLTAICDARIAAWRYLEAAFGEIGCRPTLPLDPGTVPGAFMFTPHDGIVSEEIKQTYQLHGIEASVFYPWHAVYIPCHQRLTPGAIKYMVSIYKRAYKSIYGP